MLTNSDNFSDTHILFLSKFLFFAFGILFEKKPSEQLN